MTDPAGAVAGRIYAFRDISAERSVEQMKSDFVSTVSHELRTPLTSIYGFAETLLREDVALRRGGAARRSSRYIASESERLTSIVDRLLSVAQLDTGDMAVQLAETDVGAVVSEAVRSTESAGRPERPPLRRRRSPTSRSRPRPTATSSARCSRTCSTTRSGTRRPAAPSPSPRAGASDAVEVSVEDEGVGIPHAEQERIFRKFYRGDAARGRRRAGATGLGLFLAEGLVTAMGGRIRVDSGEGKGSTFVLELRAAESET